MRKLERHGNLIFLFPPEISTHNLFSGASKRFFFPKLIISLADYIPNGPVYSHLIPDKKASPISGVCLIFKVSCTWIPANSLS